MVRLTFVQARRAGILPKKREERTQPCKISKAVWNVRKLPDGILFIIPENMVSINVWKNKWHWTKQRDYQKRLTEEIKKLALMVRRPTMERARVEVTHYFRVRRTRDKDNQVPKFILDALRYAGVIAEDNADVLELPEPVFKIDKTAWRTEIYIREIVECRN